MVARGRGFDSPHLHQEPQKYASSRNDAQWCAVTSLPILTGADVATLLV